MIMQRLRLSAIIKIHRNIDVDYKHVLKLFLQLHLRKRQLLNLIYLETVTGDIFTQKYFTIVDLKATFDRVSRGVIWAGVNRCRRVVG